MRAGDAEVSEQERGGFCLHRAATVGVQRELTWRHVVLLDRVVEQRLEQAGGFRVGDTPADHAAAENIQDDVEIKVALVHFQTEGEMAPTPSCYAVTGWRRTESGRPATNIRFSTATPMAASVCWAAKPRARSRGPISVL
jgi:hypothetical protein